MDNTIHTLLQAMWEDYLELAPDARSIHDLFAASNNGVVVNDHIALRTYNLPRVNLGVIASAFIDYGYVEGGDYEFPARKLFAKHFQHPDPKLPKVFISELLVEELSEQAQKQISSLIDQIPPEATQSPLFCYSGRPWQLDTNTYDELLAESEYAAWVAAFGYRANHFTVSINHLSEPDNITALNSLLQKHGYVLNDTGGLVKGSPDVLLEQSSTMAKKVTVDFTDGVREIPGCFYEFAKRYPAGDGNLYQGFVAASADKIFTSTNTKAE
ncbi:succinyldiaminopimelate aminotransferase [Endozoicomonas montiporae]|uniref:2-oxoadipate dioxygenase/decarboxylase n=2 Tax=Endozoicomonas montiporae TaxID=1027273 RepID=A0A081N8T7_9GAMM|nr:DUF1338 domain-containing protein [Endozoicomonas montiporae]AMO55228.1 hypothetical protein EZMO1_1014 [Endozoicomonas montiporae CL-33]KEQ14860.1 succinyldiaminopimelate aminotransferase [Endozoicomonas montiporae]